MKFEDEQTAIGRTLAHLGLLITDADIELLCTEAKMIGSAQLHRYRWVPEGKVQYTVTVDGHPELELKGFTTTLYKITDLSSRSLIDAMGLTDLHDELNNTNWELTSSGASASTLFDRYLHILESNNNTEAYVATALLAKFWMGTPNQHYIETLPKLQAISSSFFFPINVSLNDFTATQAYNILAGRSVLKFRELENDPASFYGTWKELRQGQLVDIAPFDLGKMLEHYGVKEYEDEIKGKDLIYDLLNGDKTRCHIPGPEGDRKVFIAADPSRSDLKLYQPDGVRLVIVKKELDDQRARKREIQQWKRKPGKRL